jgi:hypothetical protein
MAGKVSGMRCAGVAEEGLRKSRIAYGRMSGGDFLTLIYFIVRHLPLYGTASIQCRFSALNVHLPPAGRGQPTARSDTFACRVVRHGRSRIP